MKKAESSIIMVTILVVVIIAMVAISVVFNLIRDQSEGTGIVNDQFVATNGSCTRVTNECIRPSSTTSIVNSTGAGQEAEGNFTVCGTSGDQNGYEIGAGADKGIVGATMNASYTEESCIPITGLTRNIISYIPLLMAVIVLVFVAGFIKS